MGLIAVVVEPPVLPVGVSASLGLGVVESVVPLGSEEPVEVGPEPSNSAATTVPLAGALGAPASLEGELVDSRAYKEISRERSAIGNAVTLGPARDNNRVERTTKEGVYIFNLN